MSNLWTDNGYYNIEAVKDGSIFEGELKWDEWVEKYKPIKNHITKYPNKDADYDMFETYGDEQEYVYSLDEKLVWTEVQGDCSMLLLAGRHFVNRLNYYVCEIPWETGNEQVLISVEVECECYDDEKFDWGGDPDCKLGCEGEGYRTEYVD
jgi:hypothetical protein